MRCRDAAAEQLTTVCVILGTCVLVERPVDLPVSEAVTFITCF